MLKLDRLGDCEDCPAMSQAARRAALLLAIVAMVFKGLLPTGWMPNPTGFDETALILCDMDMSAQDMAAMMAANPDMDMSGMDMTHGGGKDGPATGHGHSSECPFAAAFHGGASLAGAAFALPARAAAFAQAPHHEHSAILMARYQPQSPRAPPTSFV